MDKNTNIEKIGRILKFTIDNKRFPKTKHVKENTIFHIAEKTMKNFVNNKVKKIVHLNPIELNEIKVVAELKTHHPMQSSDDRLLNRHISNTVGYLIENTSDSTIYIQIYDESMSLEEESRVDILLEPGDIKVITSLQFALIALNCNSKKFGNASIKVTVPQSVLDEIISKTSLINLGNFVQLDREDCDENILLFYVD